jgi:hypothetical protein
MAPSSNARSAMTLLPAGAEPYIGGGSVFLSSCARTTTPELTASRLLRDKAVDTGIALAMAPASC